MRVYQYVKADVIHRALTPEGFWVKASHPCDFNDPFECTGGVFGCPTCTFVEEFYADRPDQLLVASQYGDTTKYAVNWLWRAFRDRKFLGQAYKISCFVNSHRANQFAGSDIRMWTHYADCGMGVRLEFDTEKMPFYPEVIRYTEEAPKLDLSMVHHIGELDSFIDKCLVTKHKIWEPEQEVRVVFRGPNDAVHLDPENKIYRWLLPLDSLVSITIGESLLKAMDGKMEQILRCAIEESNRHVALYAAIRDYNVYGMSCRSISL